MNELLIDGYIVQDEYKWIYEFLEIPATSLSDVRGAIKDAGGEPLTVKINSYGGDAVTGYAMYTELREYAGDVTVKIIGFAASAASVVAMAGDRVLMSPAAQMMIHNAWTYAEGDSADFEKTAEMLKSNDRGIAAVYALKSGMSEEEALALMERDSWFDAQKALELKLIDEIMFAEADAKPLPVFNAFAPHGRMVAALKQFIPTPPPPAQDGADTDIRAAARLKIEQERFK